jgi:dihydrofolate reductase
VTPTPDGRTGRTIWHFTMSLDGFIADRHGTLAWMPTDAGPAPMGNDLVPTIGAILAGRRTYDLGVRAEPPAGGRPYGGAYTGPVFVLTHRTAPAAPEPDIRFVTGGLGEALGQARAAAGDRNVVIFGASTGQQCLRAGELDELLVHIAPVLLGTGIPAFPRGEDPPRSFDVVERSGPHEVTSLRLKPRTNGQA